MTRLSLLTAALAATSLLLTACSDRDPRPKRAEVRCADVRNPDRPSACAPRASLDLISSAQAARTFERGEVSRGEQVLSEIAVASPIDLDLWIEARFDAGCGGTGEPWVIMPKQPVTVRGGDTANLGAAGECGDMPLGRRQLVITAWQADGETVIDSAAVNFTLTD